MDPEKNTQSDEVIPAENQPSPETGSDTVPPQKPKNRLLVSGLFVILVLLGVVLFFVFRSGSTKNTNASSPSSKGASGGTGSNGSTKKTNELSPELKLNRPRSVSKPKSPPFKSIDLKKP